MIYRANKQGGPAPQGAGPPLASGFKTDSTRTNKGATRQPHPSRDPWPVCLCPLWGPETGCTLPPPLSECAQQGRNWSCPPQSGRGAAELDGVRFRFPSHLTKFEEASSKRRKVRHEQRFSDSLWRGRHRCGVPLNGGKGKAHRKRPGKAALQVLEERISIRVIMPMGENC